MAEPRSLVIPDTVRSLIQTEADARGIPSEIALGILGAENVGNYDLSPGLKSPAGARGLWQLMSGAVKDTGRDPKTFQFDDPIENTKAALDYIKILHTQFEGDPVLTTAAYNAGAGRVREILKGGGGPEDLPDETQTYLVNSDRFSQGYLTRPSGKVAAEAPAVVAQAPPAEAQVLPVAASTPPTLPTDVAQRYGDAGSGMKSLYQGLVAPAVESMAAFPRQVASQVQGLLAPPDAYTPEPIDPLDALNFAAGLFSFSPPGAAMGRLANAAIGGGLGVLEQAREYAQNTTAEGGVDWGGLGPGERTSRIMDELDTDRFVADGAMGAVVGAVFGGKSGRTPTLTKTELFNREAHLAREADASALRAYERQTRQTQTQNLSAGMTNVGETAAVMRENELAQQAFQTRVAPFEAEVAGAEARTGLSRVPGDAFAQEKRVASQHMRDRMLQEYKLPPSNPATPIFEEELLGQFGGRSLQPARVANVEAELAGVAKLAKESNTYKDQIVGLTRPLADVENVTPQINKLLSKAAQTANPVKRANLVGRAEKLKEQFIPPTVETAVKRAQAVEDFRRSKMFKDATPVEKKVVGDLSKAMRREGGFIEQLLQPEEAAIWQRGNAVSKQYRQDERAVTIITEAFADVDAGAPKIRRTLAAKERFLVAKYGKENFDSLLGLARDMDTLATALPDVPKGKALPAATKLTPIGKPPAPTAKDPSPESRRASTARTLTRMVNAVYYRGTPGAMLGLAAGASPAMVGALGLSGMALGALVTNRTLRESFRKMVRHMDNTTSTPFVKAFARFRATAEVEQALGEPAPESPPPAPPTEVQAPERGAMPITTQAGPPLSSRMTGGPIPAPQRPQQRRGAQL